MLVRIAEDLLLNHALKEGLVSPEDLAAAAPACKPDETTERWGPRVDALIERGLLSEAAIQRLATVLSAFQSPAATEPTLEGTKAQPEAELALDPKKVAPPSQPQPDEVPTPPSDTAPPPAAEPLGLARTVDSTNAGLNFSSSVSVSPFPVPSWDRYEFLSVLGRGGMGAVYKARDRRLGRIVALKFIHGDDPGQIQRFMQEARAQARLDHPSICQVFEVGTVDNKPYIAMQLVDGLPLDLASRTMTLFQKVQVMKDAVEAMHAAHEQNIIHRDIKPSNIMVTRGVAPDGTVRHAPVIMDFGLARDSGAGDGLTESGAVMGTPAYMSPEQARGDVRRLDRRTDVYSLGATLYDILVGRPPFADETVVGILLKVMNEVPQPLRSHDPKLPEALELIVSKCLNKEPEQRYLTTKALADDLGRYLSSQRVVARRLSYRYRLRYWASRNRALAALGVALLFSVLFGSGYGIRTYYVDKQKEREARREAELAKQLGQDINDIEWRVRIAYSLPLHDTSPDKARVRQRMVEVERDIRSYGAVGTRLGHYVLGRGHLALHEFDKAHEHLKQAETLGVQEPELDYALGRVLGEKYSKALEDARRGGDKSFFEKRSKELEAQYLQPALIYLERSRQRQSIPSKYLDALLDYYNRRYDAALLNAHFAERQDPWLYEAIQLQGDVHMARALEQKDRGDNDQAERNFMEAIRMYDRAAEIGRSDHRLYESTAEAWVRWEELELQRGRNPEPQFRAALAAADRALEAAPTDSYGYTKKATAYYFRGRYAQAHGAAEEVLSLIEAQLTMSQHDLALHRDNIYAHDMSLLAYQMLVPIYNDKLKPIESLIISARAHFEEAIKINSTFPWIYNDYGLFLYKTALAYIVKNKNPEAILTLAISTIKKSILIDNNYVYAYNSLATANMLFVRWYVEHGQEAELFVSEALHAVNSAIKINPRYISPLGTAGTIYNLLSTNKLDAELDGRRITKEAIKNLQSMIEINKKILFAYRDLAKSYYLLSRHELALHQDPSQSFQGGLQAIRNCYQLVANNPFCQTVEAQLLSAQADWTRLQGKPFVPILNQALRQAREAPRQDPDDEEFWRVLAETCLQLAGAGPPRQLPLSLIDEGIGAAGQALRIAPGWPRAIAVQGALYLLRAKAQSDAVQRQEPLQRAQDAFIKAFQGNPLLKRRFGAMADEVEQLLRRP